MTTEAVEMCPHCMSENTYPDWNVEKQGYVARCQCGREIMLCDECSHADDNEGQRCDWHEVRNEDGSVEGHCFRGVTHEKKAGASQQEQNPKIYHRTSEKGSTRLYQIERRHCMAYNMATDTYSCDTCGFENEWDASDDKHGELWGCEKCGDIFCSKCFIDRYGRDEYMNMMQNSDQIYCPKCWEEQRKKEDL